MATTLLAALLLTPLLQSEPPAPADAVCTATTEHTAAADSAGVAIAATWYDGGYNQALREARAAGRSVLVAFLPEWSDYSNKLRDETLPDPAVAAELSGLLCLEVDADDARGLQVVRLHAVTSYPTLLVLGTDGRIEDRIDGYIPPGPLVAELRRIKAGQDTVSDRRTRYAEHPDNLACAAALAGKLAAVGDSDEAARLFDDIRARDPGGDTTDGARLIIQDAIDVALATAGANGPSAQAVAAVAETVERVHDERGRFEGYSRLADLARAAGDDEAALAAWRGAWARIPEGLVLDWGNDLVFLLIARIDQLDASGRVFMLEVAEAVAGLAEERYAANPEAPVPVLPPDITPGGWLAQRLDGLAWGCFANGDADRAVALAERCVALDPQNEEYPGRAGLFRGEG